MSASIAETRTMVSSVVIAATPEQIWQAMTDPEQTAQWYFGTRVRSTWEPGSPIKYVDDDGDVLLAGEVVEVVPHERLVHTFGPCGRRTSPRTPRPATTSGSSRRARRSPG